MPAFNTLEPRLIFAIASGEQNYHEGKKGLGSKYSQKFRKFI